MGTPYILDVDKVRTLEDVKNILRLMHLGYTPGQSITPRELALIVRYFVLNDE